MSLFFGTDIFHQLDVPVDPINNFFCSTRAAALGFKNILRYFVIFRKLIKITYLTICSVPFLDQILCKLPELNFCPVIYFVHRCGTRDRTWNLEGQNFAALPIRLFRSCPSWERSNIFSFRGRRRYQLAYRALMLFLMRGNSEPLWTIRELNSFLRGASSMFCR